ncbi:MAG: FAD-binding oxidoreductase [Candidatus Aenigmarchaeota archaeon]|nr:FAD-binding oxidoreductase [Candidatus Aenigmarchaeota archaeon]
MQANPIWPIKSSFPTLEKDVRCDILIVGAGIAGISSAYYLMQKGYDVIVIEEDEIGSGATGASSGTLYFGTGLDVSSTIEIHGEKNTKIIWDETKESINIIEQLIKKYSIDCGFKNPGAISVAKTEEEVDHLLNNSKNLKTLGFSSEFLEQDQVKDFFKSRDFIAGLREPCMQLKPALFCSELSKASGINVFSKSPMLDFKKGESIVVNTPKARIKCSNLVIATNIKPIFGLENHCYIENTTIVASQVMKDKIKEIWNKDTILWTVDDKYDILYTEDNRAMLDLFTSKGIDDKINFYYPSSGFKKEFIYGDSWFDTEDKMPILGNTKNLPEGSENINVAIAMGDQGIVTGFTSGRKIPLLMKNIKDTFLDLSSPNRFNAI